jgi:hypothetical protein
MALFSDLEGSSTGRVELNRKAQQEIIEDLSREKPIFMRKSETGALRGEQTAERRRNHHGHSSDSRVNKAVVPVKSTSRRTRKSKFAGSALLKFKPKGHQQQQRGEGEAVFSPRVRRSLASRRSNEDELSLLFSKGMKQG